MNMNTEWQVEGSTVYRLMEDGYRKGEPVFRNEFSFLVQADKSREDQAPELAKRLQLLLELSTGLSDDELRERLSK
ncbi:hypothetical protein HA052_04310 [Chromobacterium haemolyticum]|uniref:Uncharacterized protein n=1 Tax=Chromobacterium fluminis TaxID=3044269 RepID=A0ABX0L5S4_9NEIS|nr:hypothetical protein [Chromobacterium haemolyticum]NHR04413.1 hypothetical protein [Chromobacterium haemolyticum]